MAFSPSPTSPIGVGRRSPTPPAQPMSKRDKKRSQHMAHQQELLNDFSQNRDGHYRRQLISLQVDMSLIAQANLYDPEPLDDSPDDIVREVESTAAGTPYQSEMSVHAGKWYSEFVHEVNDAKEAKELELIQLENDHDARLKRSKFECDYRLHLAAEECKSMTNTLRERLVQTLTSRRTRLMKEKEQLDIADTNALLLHPSQFTITNPSSPGGHTSRKTRFTRNRADADDTANGLLGDGNNKRKRKAADDDYGSPSRNGHSTPADRVKAQAIAHQTAPIYSINSLFTEKELGFQSHQAQIAARHFFSTSHKDGDTNGSGKRSRDSDEDKSSGSGEDSGADDEDGMEAPGMDRTTSQNVHVTRSTRTAGGMAGLNLLSDLAEKAATRPNAPYATLHTYQQRSGTFLPSPSRLMNEEIQEDLMDLNHADAQPKEYLDRRMVEEALKPLAEGYSNLAPDWPVYLDVHLVDIDPRRAPAIR